MFRRLPAVGFATGVMIVGSLTVPALASAHTQLVSVSVPAAAATYGFQADAYGSSVRLGRAVKSGPSALVALACTATPGITHRNTAGSVGVPSVFASGTVTTRAASKTTSTGRASTATATTEQVDALGGQVRATAVKSVSTTAVNTTTGQLHVSSAGTTFTGLVVAGKRVAANPAPNTKITLPGVGYVILNQTDSRVGSSTAALTVIGLDVVVSPHNNLHLPAGTQIVVSAAASSLGGPVAGLLTGLAYGAYATVGATVTAGRSFHEYLGCLGTGGVTRTNTGVAGAIRGVVRTGTIKDTAEGVASPTRVSGEMTSTVQHLNLLGGAVTATAVHADVTAVGTRPALRDKSSFVGLHVAGHAAIGANLRPNTKIALAGIGTLYLHLQTRTAHSIAVTMARLVVTHAANRFGLRLGTIVNVGFAKIGIRS